MKGMAVPSGEDLETKFLQEWNNSHASEIEQVTSAWIS